LYSDWLWAGRSGHRIPVGVRFSAPVQTGPGVHPASCTKGTRSFPGVKSSRGVTLTPYPLLVPWSRKSRAIPLLPLWAVWPVQSPSVCTRVHFTLLLPKFRKRAVRISIRGQTGFTVHMSPFLVEHTLNSLTPNDPYRGRTAPHFIYLFNKYRY